MYDEMETSNKNKDLPIYVGDHVLIIKIVPLIFQ